MKPAALTLTLLILLGSNLAAEFDSSTQPALTSTLIASGLSQPLFATSPPGDTSRLFIVEQTGRIRIFDGSQMLAAPFLDISGKISCCDEEGLLGLAFHPNFDSNGFFFVNYTTTSGGRKTRIERYSLSIDPNLADISSALTILEISQPFSNHNGGMIAFGPDGFLYIGMGDGGSGGDPQNNGQNGNTLLGKLLRIDVDSDSSGRNYAIPPSNPFVGAIDTLDEIWAFGVRNPWRFSFDRGTGDLYIADVGQGLIEEINVQLSQSLGGENYGWRLKEGTNCFIPSSGCESLTFLTDPITQYTHVAGRCSITGGYVYRGCAIPDLAGTYFYADWCTQEIWSFRYDGTAILDSTSRSAELGININVTSFGQDGKGELYVIGSGQVFKIIPVDPPSDCQLLPCCMGVTGNIDNSPDEKPDLADLTFFIDHLFISFVPIACPFEGNIDGDLAGVVDIADLTFLIDHLFINFPPTSDCL